MRLTTGAQGRYARHSGAAQWSPEAMTTGESERRGTVPLYPDTRRSWVPGSRSAGPGTTGAEEKTMPQSYDLILKGGVVVNQDGRGERDVGINGSTIAAIGDLGQA